jgi:hypothetical protein
MSDERSNDAGVPGWQRAYVAVCAGIIGFSLAYGLTDYARLPRPFLDGREHTWRIAASAGAREPMGYVGLWLYGLAGGVALATVALLALRLRKQPIREPVLTLGLAWAMTAVGLVGAYFTWNNYP